MATKLAIDKTLVAKAMKLGGHKTQSAAINAALAEYLERRKQAAILDVFGKIDFDPNYNYKQQRKRS